MKPKRESLAGPRQPRDRRLLWIGVILLALVGVQAIAVASNPESPWTQGIDDIWRAWVGVGPESGAYTWFVPMFFQYLGQLPGIVSVFLLLPLALFLVGRWRSALYVMAVQIAAPGLVSQVLKNTVNRPRPEADDALGLFGPLFHVDHGSFPSGHATSAGALAVILIALIPHATRARTIALFVISAFLIVGMVWQRTLVNAHWITDAVSGVMVGAGVSLVLWWAFEPWLRQDRGRRPWFMPKQIDA